MAGGILVFGEQRNGNLKKVSYEVASEGRRMADQLGVELTGCLVGQDIRSLAESLGPYGVDRVFLADSPLLAQYSAEGYSRALVHVCQRVAPEVILLPATAMGKDLGPTVAARLDTGLATDCTGIQLENGQIRLVRPVYAGKAISTVVIHSRPVMASLRPNVFSATVVAEGRTAPIEAIELGLTAADIRARVVEVVSGTGGKVDVAEADMVVSGGRGLQGPENFTLIEELAGILGAATGASRAVVDAGWRPHSEQVGQTGKTVSPLLYIACGISGAIQHLAGMSSSRWIVAINKDPEAPIFKKADYGIVGDVFEVLPALTGELRRVLGKE